MTKKGMIEADILSQHDNKYGIKHSINQEILYMITGFFYDTHKGQTNKLTDNGGCH